MKKRLMVVMGLAVAALGIGATAAVLGTTPAVFTRATGETRSIVLTAADFSDGNGDFSKAGLSFHYEKISVVGNTVTIATSGTLQMTMSHYSGESVSEGGLMGNGFTALAFTDYYQDGVGSVAFGKKGTVDDILATYTVAASMDLTHQDGGAEVPSDNRRRIHINAAHTLSFTKITYSYECVEAKPTIEISGDQFVEKNATGNLTATTERVDGSATYNWTSSNTDVATVVGNGKSDTVTGVAAGGATITVKAIVNEAVVATDTFALTVTDPASKVYMDWNKSNKDPNHGPLQFDGAGLIIGLDLTSVGRNEAWVNDNKDKISFEFSREGWNLVNWQTPPWSPFPGFYGSFPSADFSTLTSITIRMPNDHDVLAVAEMTLSWSGSTYTVLTLNGQSFAAYMGIAA